MTCHVMAFLILIASRHYSQRWFVSFFCELHQFAISKMPSSFSKPPLDPSLDSSLSLDSAEAEQRLREAEERLRDAMEELQRRQRSAARGSHAECDHADVSCVANAIGNLCQSFLLSYGVRVGIGILLRAFKLARGQSYSSLLDLKVSKMHLSKNLCLGYNMWDSQWFRSNLCQRKIWLLGTKHVVLVFFLVALPAPITHSDAVWGSGERKRRPWTRKFMFVFLYAFFAVVCSD